MSTSSSRHGSVGEIYANQLFSCPSAIDQLQGKTSCIPTHIAPICQINPVGISAGPPRSKGARNIDLGIDSFPSSIEVDITKLIRIAFTNHPVYDPGLAPSNSGFLGRHNGGP